MDLLFEKYNINSFPLAAPCFFGAAVFMLVRMLFSVIYHLKNDAKLFLDGVMSGFTFGNLLLLLLFAAIGVCLLMKLRIGVTGATLLAVVIELVYVFEALYMGITQKETVGARGVLWVLTRLFVTIGLLLFLLVQTLPLFQPRSFGLCKQFYFVPASVMALGFVIKLFSGWEKISAAANVFAALSICCLLAGVFFGCSWILEDNPITDQRKMRLGKDYKAVRDRLRSAEKEMRSGRSSFADEFGGRTQYAGSSAAGSNKTQRTSADSGRSPRPNGQNFSRSGNGRNPAEEQTAAASMIVECPTCGQKMRLPLGKKLNVTCPRCKTSFFRQT